MLRPVKTVRRRKSSGSFVIVASRYNERYANTRAGAIVADDGAGGTGRVSGIICLGVIFQGQTSHAQHIGWGVTHALAQIQVQYRLPVIHGVFVFEKKEHAAVRCLGKKHNRGTEAARTALEMARVMADS